MRSIALLLFVASCAGSADTGSPTSAEDETVAPPGADGPKSKEPVAVPGKVNPAGMKRAVLQAQSLLAAVEGQNSDKILNAVLNVSLSAQNAVAIASGEAPAVGATAEALLTTQGPLPTGARSCDKTGCVLNQFGPGGTSLQISGTIMFVDSASEGKTATWDLTGRRLIVSGEQTLTYDYNWIGDVTVSPIGVDGTAKGVWKVSNLGGGQNVVTDFGNLTRFETVRTEGACPKTGAIFAKWWQVITMNGHEASGDQLQAYEATHEFKGACR